MNKNQYDELKRRLEKHVSFLPDKPEETLESTLKALHMAAAGVSVSAAMAIEAELHDLDADQEARFEELVEKRISGIPLAHITGRQQFMGVELLAGPDALVPRGETEILCRAALDFVGIKDTGALVIDVCTGSGNLAVAMGVLENSVRICASDLSEDAVALARQNVSFQDLSSRISIFQGDLLSPFDNDEFLGKVDLIVCNPPYISSSKVEAMADEISEFEPKLAFDGGPFGVNILRKLIREAPKYLKPGGGLAFEVGLGQGESMKKKLENTAAYSDIKAHRDSEGNIRAVLAVYKPCEQGKKRIEKQ